MRPSVDAHHWRGSYVAEAHMFSLSLDVRAQQRHKWADERRRTGAEWGSQRVALIGGEELRPGGEEFDPPC